MGMYTGLRFKGVVKKEFRNNFGSIALNGDWKNSPYWEFSNFGNLFRSSFIPCGMLCYMPEEWDKPNEFGIKYNKNTGYWTFQCSLKNYEHEIEKFFDLVPYFIESVEVAEYFYEEDEWSQLYGLVDGKMVEINNKYIKYES